METFSALLAFCSGNPPVSGEFPAQRPVTRSFDVFFDLHQIKGWVNTREAGELRRHLAHYDAGTTNPAQCTQEIEHVGYSHPITAASYWTPWRRKLPASWWFPQPFCSEPDKRKHQSSASLAIVRGIHQWPVNSPNNGMSCDMLIYKSDGAVYVVLVYV